MDGTARLVREAGLRESHLQETRFRFPIRKMSRTTSNTSPPAAKQAEGARHLSCTTEQSSRRQSSDYWQKEPATFGLSAKFSKLLSTQQEIVMLAENVLERRFSSVIKLAPDPDPGQESRMHGPSHAWKPET